MTVSKSTGGSLEASVELSPEQIDALNNGRFYIQIHSESAPEGNLWGWLLA
ncbi:CHRD domain protein [compost metagenome]